MGRRWFIPIRSLCVRQLYFLLDVKWKMEDLISLWTVRIQNVKWWVSRDLGEIFAVCSALINCDVRWGFLTALICGQRRSLMFKVKERKHFVCVRAQPDLAAAEVSEEMLIGYFRLLTKTWPCSFRAQTWPSPCWRSCVEIDISELEKLLLGAQKGWKEMDLCGPWGPAERRALAGLAGLCPNSWAGQGISTGPPSPARQSFTSGTFYLLRWASEIMVRGTVLAGEYAG